MNTPKNAIRKVRRVYTSEEHAVSFVLAISFFIGIFLAAVSNVVILFGYISGQATAFAAYADFLLRTFGFQAIVSAILAFSLHLSRRQFEMMARFMLGLDVGLPLALMTYGYFVLGAMIPTIREFRGVGILLVALMNVSLFGLVAVLGKLLGRRAHEWVRIKYVPEKASLAAAEKHLGEARARLEKGFFGGASEDFHAAALMFLRLEDWSRTAENYWMGAEALSKEPDSDFGFSIAWLYALSASAHILNGNIGEAEKALRFGKQTLKDRKVDKRREEKVSSMLEFLTAILSRNIQQANTTWQKLSRRMAKWGYPTTEETIILFERNLLKSNELAREPE